MLTRRLYYAAALAVSLLFYILYPHWFAWYLFVLLMLILPFDVLISLPGILTQYMALTAPYTLEQGEEGTLVVTALRGKAFPSGSLNALLRIKSDDTAVSRRINGIGAHRDRYDLAIDTSHCGVISYELRRFWVISILGLFSMPFKPDIRVAVLVAPLPVKPPRDVSLPQLAGLVPKPGGGAAEDHELRQYRPGDPVKTIHWKLSAKHDDLIIREAMVPPPQSRLVRAAQWGSPDERDLVLGRARWVSGYLLENDLPHFVKLGDHSPVMEITGPDDFIKCLYYVLNRDEKRVPAASYPPGYFSWVYFVDGARGEE